ncbi:MAG: class I SAM-dependent methyltransferase [Acidobacteriota bacterium]|nr:class I SAM-dependent methyltransferase [Acidobacteriota bacterium]
MLALLDPLYRTMLWPFKLKARTGSPIEAPELVARTEAYNRAAEDYYADFANKDFLLRKPFSESATAALHLIDTGVLLQALNLQAGDTVVELGAGSCWLSQMLNRYGCRTISVDVSPTALEIGRQLFQRDPATNWDLRPQFIAYDGHTLPIDSGSCDRAIISDAFHHIPNQGEVLHEICRVLKPDGVLGMSEPGRGHGEHQQSRMEASTGILENELVLEDLVALALACGFTHVHVVVAGARHPFEIPALDLAAFCGGKNFALYWRRFSGALERHHYLLFYKRRTAPDTTRPGRLQATISTPRPDHILHLRSGEAAALAVSITNDGDTNWLALPRDGRGWTRLGVHLLKEDATGSRALVNFDWHRADLSASVAPGEQADVAVTLPAIIDPGRYVAVFDLVVERLAWFAEYGSSTLEIVLDVE